MNLPEINSALSSRQVFDMFVRQISKDFETAGLDGSFAITMEPLYTHVHENLMRQVAMIAGNSGAVGSLLYRVDITERQLNSALSGGAGTFESIIADLIIRRELSKISTRIRFSS